MILSIGEILADVITANGETKEYLGGAPFNVAADIAYLGGDAGFVGRVGNDRLGAFLTEEAKQSKFRYLNVQVDEKRRTTRALVSLDKSGERDFRFDRKDAADYFIDTDEIDFSKLPQTEIVHLGTLMLSEEEGVARMERLLEKAKSAKKLISMDMNFRSDIYPSAEAAIEISARFLKEADIVKVSEDELEMLTGGKDPENLKKLTPHLIAAVTMGAKGSAVLFRGEVITERVGDAPRVDTTGAGDAFFAGLLLKIAETGAERLNAENLRAALRFANAAGEKAIGQFGAILK